MANMDPRSGNPKDFARKLDKALRGEKTEANGSDDDQGGTWAHCPRCGVYYDPAMDSSHSGH